jgi:RHS repeat-associated protein
MGVTRYTTVRGSIVSENRNGVIRDYITNPLGNTISLLDNTQTQTDQWSYMPFGETSRIKGSNSTAMLYVGARSCRQNSTGTKSLMGRRVLDLQKARWMTQDPIGFAGGDWNLYRYTYNTPVSALDPSGLKPLGDRLCRQLDGPSSHHCSGAQWSACVTKCGGIGNVNYCCSGSGCVCITCSCGCKGMGGKNCTCKPPMTLGPLPPTPPITAPSPNPNPVPGPPVGRPGSGGPGGGGPAGGIPGKYLPVRCTGPQIATCRAACAAKGIPFAACVASRTFGFACLSSSPPYYC